MQNKVMCRVMLEATGITGNKGLDFDNARDQRCLHSIKINVHFI